MTTNWKDKLKKTYNRYILFGLYSILLNFIIVLSVSCEIKNNPKIDSLLYVLKKTKGADKIAVQIELAMQLYGKDNTRALKFAESALKASQNGGNKSLEMRAYIAIGRVWQAADSLDLALANYDSAHFISNAINDNFYKGEILFYKGFIQHIKGEDLLSIELFNQSVNACRLSDNYRKMGASYSLMGTIFRTNGMYDRAIEYIVKSQYSYDKDGYSEGYAWTAYLLGRIYSDMHLPEKAQEYYLESQRKYKELSDINGNKEGIAICQEQISLLNLESGNFEEAEKSITHALKIYTEDGTKYGISNAYKIIGMIEYSKGNYIQAKEYLEKALKIKIEIGDALNQPGIYEYIGLCLIKRGLLKKGFNNVNMGLDLAVKNNQKKVQFNIYSKLTEVYLSLNDLEKAISCQKKQIEIQNSILTGSASIKMEQLQAIHEIDEKNIQIAELEKQNEINSLQIEQQRIVNLIIITGSFFIVMIAFIIYLYNKKIRKRNEKLKEANATRNKFFSIIAHDLRGPLGNLVSLGELLWRKHESINTQSQRIIMQNLAESASNTFSLMDNLLKWANSNSGRMDLKPEVLDLNKLIDKNFQFFKLAAEKKEVSLINLINNGLHIFADAYMIDTVIRNLLSNAIKFTLGGGRIEITAEIVDEKKVKIGFSDTGVGIEAEKLSGLFKLESSYTMPGTDKERGTGLGLKLCSEFIEKNKGTIDVESTPGKGSTFWVTLPFGENRT